MKAGTLGLPKRGRFRNQIASPNSLALKVRFELEADISAATRRPLSAMMNGHGIRYSALLKEQLEHYIPAH